MRKKGKAMKRIASILKTKKARKDARKDAEKIDRLSSLNGQFCPTEVRVEYLYSNPKVIITDGFDEYSSKIHGLEERAANNPVFCHFLHQALRDRSFQPTGCGALIKRR